MNATIAYGDSPIQFKPAVKHQAKLRFALAGPAGSGKTYTALSLAMAMGGKVAVLDTEHGSASKYADLFQFDVLELTPPYHPDRYVEAIRTAAQARYDTLVLDSLSHAWYGPGGMLEIVDKLAAQLKTSNSLLAWKHANPIHQRLVEAILAAPLHVIGCMRSKTGYEVDRDDKGRVTVQKLGMQPIQRDGVEYEFDVYAEMTVPDNRMLVAKTRCPPMHGKVFDRPTGKELAAILLPWLSGLRRQHWSDDPAKCAAFLAKCGEAGLDEAAIKELAGLNELADWAGTAQDLLTTVQAAIPLPKEAA